MRDWLTPDTFNVLIVLNMIVGLGLAGWRLRRDLARARALQQRALDDTQPHRPL